MRAHPALDARRIGSAHPSTWPRLLFLLFCASGARLFFLCVWLLGEGPKATRGLPQADQRPAACVSLLKLSVHAIHHATAAARSSAVETQELHTYALQPNWTKRCSSVASGTVGAMQLSATTAPVFKPEYSSLDLSMPSKAAWCFFFSGPVNKLAVSCTSNPG